MSPMAMPPLHHTVEGYAVLLDLHGNPVAKPVPCRLTLHGDTCRVEHAPLVLLTGVLDQVRLLVRDRDGTPILEEPIHFGGMLSKGSVYKARFSYEPRTIGPLPGIEDLSLGERAKRIELIAAHESPQFGCAGSHRGSGAPDCPRATHHHHDFLCPAPTREEWEQAGREGDITTATRAEPRRPYDVKTVDWTKM